MIEEYQGATTTAAYVYGASGLIAGALNGQVYYYYQDGSGSTSHLADSNGVLKEWYRYDLQGTPFIYDANNNQLSASALGVRHLFTGQQWYPGSNVYDLRNRFYSPDIGRFLQPDPIGFDGDPTNLYRYCGNNPVTRSDPNGTLLNTKAELGGEPRGAMGDFLDFGYWGGDGTAGPYFGLMGYDWSGNELGMLQTEQYYASYPVSYSQALGANGWGSIGGMIVPQPILRAKAVGATLQGTVSSGSPPSNGQNLTMANTTLGIGVSAIAPGSGDPNAPLGTQGYGVYVDLGNGEFGWYQVTGTGTGIDFGIGAGITVINGGASIFAGPYHNDNAGYGLEDASVHFDQSGGFLGITYGLAYPMPGSYSVTNTMTTIHPIFSLWGH